MNIEDLKIKIDSIFTENSDSKVILQSVCDYLKEEVVHYDWVGFYFKNGDKPELKLAEYAGHETEHTIIPYGKGICGQVAESDENFVVQDVTEQDNYISCGWQVKSEIVIPIFVNGENIGQIDIDSHTVNPFTEKDENLLEYVCKKVSEIL